MDALPWIGTAERLPPLETTVVFVVPTLLTGSPIYCLGQRASDTEWSDDDNFYPSAFVSHWFELTPPNSPTSR